MKKTSRPIKQSTFTPLIMKLKFSFHFHSFLFSIENLNQAATFEFALGLRTCISSTLALLPVSRLGNLRIYLIVAIKKNVVVHLFGPQSESTLQKNDRPITLPHWNSFRNNSNIWAPTSPSPPATTYVLRLYTFN